MRNLLLFLLLLFVIFQVRRSFVRKPPATRAPEEGPDAGAAVSPQAIESEEVLPCAHCGLHVPKPKDCVPRAGFIVLLPIGIWGRAHERFGRCAR